MTQLAPPDARRILIVANDSSFASGLGSRLARHGFVAETASTVEEATRLDLSRYSAILSDPVLSHRNGREILLYLREQMGLASPFVFFSGPSVEMTRLSQRYSAHFVRKPVEMDELLDALRGGAGA